MQAPLGRHTPRKSIFLLQKYIDFVNGRGNKIKDVDLFFGNDPRQIERQIIDFIIKMKEENKSNYAIHNYVSAIGSFYKINDVVLNTTKVNKFMPEIKVSIQSEIFVLIESNISYVSDRAKDLHTRLFTS